MTATRKTSPCTVRTQAPVRPVATSPASIMPMMKQPKTVPMIVARPPKIEVPPISTEAIAVRRYPWPWLPKKFLFSSVSMIAAKPGEPAHQREDADLLALDVDADDARHRVGIADEEHAVAELVPVEHEPETRRRPRPSRRPASAAARSRWSPIPANGRPTITCQTELVLDAAQRVGLAAREHRRHPGPEELGRERRHERRDADARDEEAVDPADHERRGHGGDHGQPAEVVVLEQHREDEAREGDDRRESRGRSRRRR